MNRSEEMISAMVVAEHRMKLRVMADNLGVDVPHESMPIKVLKGATTGLCMAGGLALSGATAYTVGLLISSMVPWDKIESQAIQLVVKGGIVGLGTAAGMEAGKAIFDMGDDINEIIDVLCDKSLTKSLSDALSDSDVDEIMEFDNEDDESVEEE